MKKTLIIIAIIGLALALSSCKRSSIDDPSWDGPAGLSILVKGSVTPAVLLIDGRIHTSLVVVRVTDYKGNPLPNQTVFLEQLPDQYNDKQLDWGYFPNNEKIYQKATDANGEIRVNFYWPTEYYSEEMWIHAVLVINDRAFKLSEQNLLGNIPQDYIPLAMYRAGGNALETAK